MVKRKLDELNMPIDIVVNTRTSLYGNEMSIIELAIRELDFKKAKKLAKLYGINYSQVPIDEILESMEIEKCNEYLERAYKYSEKRLQTVINRLMGLV